MADNITTTTTVSTIPSGSKIATRDVTYSGDVSTNIAPVGLVTFAGADDAKTATDVPAGNGAAATALRVTLADDSTGLVAIAGTVAHDAVDSGDPLKVGFKARTALPTAVAASDRADGAGDVFGRQLISHTTPDMQISKAHNSTTTQTGVAIWTPTSGKKVVITSLVIGAYGTTAARVIIWFGATADTTYTAGTDQPVVLASFAPSATSKPGLVLTPFTPIFAITVDHVLRITTDAGISIDVTVHGYEV